MKRTIGTLLALALLTGAGFAQARGGHGGGGHFGGGTRGGAVAARPAMSGGFTRFTTGPMHFTTGQPSQFTTGPHWRPPFVGHPIVRPVPLPPRPVQPIVSHPVFGGGTVIVTTPVFPVVPVPYPYPYATPVYGGSAYAGVPTYSDAPAYSYPDSQTNPDEQGYSERDDYWYYCPDSQTYYPYVQTCPSARVKVLPEPSEAPAN